MIPWKGPATALAVLLALLQFGPTRDDCAVRESVAPPPPPPLDRSVLSLQAPRAHEDSTDSPDPFALASAPAPARASAGPARVSGPTPSRPWSVTGLVGRRAAVLVRSDGSSVVVSVGQSLDSATVVGISSAGVELQDRAGRFLLKVR